MAGIPIPNLNVNSSARQQTQFGDVSQGGNNAVPAFPFAAPFLSGANTSSNMLIIGVLAVAGFILLKKKG